MTLGLHAVPLTLALAFGGLTIIFGAFFIAVRRKDWKAPVVTTELAYDQRDAGIHARLAKADIQMVGLQNEDADAVVMKNGCTATYIIDDSVDLPIYPGTWPLVSGTGKPVSGCNGVLDSIFVSPGG